MDIDGLRAVAVLGVLCCHFGIFLRGGFVGVDVFFVISGYLITSLIRRDIEAGTFSLLAFWERRVRRIVPALAVMCATVLAAGWFLLLPHEYAALGHSQVAAAAGGSNFLFLATSGYFAAGSRETPLLHTWSLTVEEQFYLLLPVLLLWVARPGFARRRVLIVLGGLSLMSLAACVVVAERDQNAAFYLLPTRAWELLAGALLAAAGTAAATGWKRVSSELTAWIGLLLVVVPMVAYTAETPFPGWAALPPALGACLLILPRTGKAATANQCLAAPALVRVGQMSYSIYLWHWPLLVLYQIYRLSSNLHPWEKAGLTGVTLALSYASWRWVERPVRQRQVFRTRRALFVAVAAVGVLGVGAGLCVGRDGVPARFPPAVRSILDTARARAGGAALKAAKGPPSGWPRIGSPGRTPDLAVFGDSHAMALLPVLDEVCRSRGVAAVCATRPGMAPALGYQSEIAPRDRMNRQFAEQFIRYACDRPFKGVILAGCWSLYQGDDFTPKLLHTASLLRQAGLRVSVVTDVPIFDQPAPRAVVWTLTRGGDPSRLARSWEEYAQVNRNYLAVIPQLEALGVEVLDPLPLLRERGGAGGFLPYDEGGIRYNDRSHLSLYGSGLLKPLFEPLVAELAGEGR